MFWDRYSYFNYVHNPLERNPNHQWIKKFTEQKNKLKTCIRANYS